MFVVYRDDLFECVVVVYIVSVYFVNNLLICNRDIDTTSWHWRWHPEYMYIIVILHIVGDIDNLLFEIPLPVIHHLHQFILDLLVLFLVVLEEEILEIWVTVDGGFQFYRGFLEGDNLIQRFYLEFVIDDVGGELGFEFEIYGWLEEFLAIGVGSGVVSMFGIFGVLGDFEAVFVLDVLGYL